MKRLLVLAVLPLALSACSNGDAESKDAPPKSERGNIIKTIGQQASVKGDCDQNCIDFTITDISTAPPCENPLNPIEGRPINVTLDITTRPDAPKDEMTGLFQIYNWAVVDSSGTTHSNASGELDSGCPDDANAIGGFISPGSHYNGTIQFDVPTDSKTLVLDMFGQASWEWEIPA